MATKANAAKRKARRAKIRKALKGSAKKNKSGLISAGTNLAKFVVDAVKKPKK